MMLRAFAFAALLALAACGNNEGNVMEEIEAAEEREAAAVEEPQTMPSGLVIQFQSRGSDQSLAQPSAQANVQVHYEGRLVDDNSVFNSSFERGEPVEFPLEAVVPGFSEAIQMMRPGDEVIATFPGELGYGPEGRGPIPPNAALRFRIQLLAFREPNGTVVRAPAG